MSRYSLSDIPVDSACSVLDEGSGVELAYQLRISDIKAIDTAKLTIPQILEFRKDGDLMNRMRSFRLFAYQQYRGKDRAFVEDDLQKRADDYEAAVKSSGFETRVKMLSFVLESKFLLGAVATSAASFLLGQPEVGVGAIGAGTVIEVGRLSLEYAKHKNAIAQICSANPVSYLSDLRTRVATSN